MMVPTLNTYLVLSGVLFAIGFFGVLLRKNTLVIFMGLELMLVASTLALVAFSRFNGTMDGNVFVFFILKWRWVWPSSSRSSVDARRSRWTSSTASRTDVFFYDDSVRTPHCSHLMTPSADHLFALSLQQDTASFPAN